MFILCLVSKPIIQHTCEEKAMTQIITYGMLSKGECLIDFNVHIFHILLKHNNMYMLIENKVYFAQIAIVVLLHSSLLGSYFCSNTPNIYSSLD